MTTSAELPIGTAIRSSYERLRTVATTNATSSEHTLNPQTPRVKREPLLRIREKALKQASHKFHTCIKFQWQVWTQWHGQRLSVWGWNTATANTAKCSANCSGSEPEKIVFCYKWMFIPRESCCLTHASPNFAICTRLSNPFAIRDISLSLASCQVKECCTWAFHTRGPWSHVNWAKIEGAREIEIFQFNGVLLGRGWLLYIYMITCDILALSHFPDKAEAAAFGSFAMPRLFLSCKKAVDVHIHLGASPFWTSTPLLSD